MKLRELFQYEREAITRWQAGEVTNVDGGLSVGLKPNMWEIKWYDRPWWAIVKRSTIGLAKCLAWMMPGFIATQFFGYENAFLYWMCALWGWQYGTNDR